MKQEWKLSKFSSIYELDQIQGSCALILLYIINLPWIIQLISDWIITKNS